MEFPRTPEHHTEHNAQVFALPHEGVVPAKREMTPLLPEWHQLHRIYLLAETTQVLVLYYRHSTWSMVVDEHHGITISPTSGKSFSVICFESRNDHRPHSPRD